MLELDETTRTHVAAVGDYFARALERAADFALFWHAGELTAEHVLASLLDDEDCAATRIVQHAFADPETIVAEAVALAPGIMVVGSERCIPFSVLGARALEAARELAIEAGHAAVTPAHLFVAAHALVPEEIAADLAKAGTEVAVLDPADAADGEPIRRDGPLLKSFSNDARRTLGAGARWAFSLGRASVSPVHVIGGAVETDAELAKRSGTTRTRIASVAAGRDADETPIPPRALVPNQALVDLLASIPPGSGTIGFLGALQRDGSDEVRAALHRQRITETLLASSSSAFSDPAPGRD